MSIFKHNKNTISLSYQEVIDEYSDTVYKIALNMMKNEADAQDIFQEVFLRYVRNKKQFETREHLKAWFIRVTINCCNTMFTTNAKKGGSELTIEIPFEEKQTHEITYLVKELDEKYRVVIHLYYYEQYAIKEIAKIVDEKEATIKTRLVRARDVLKQKWEERENVR